MRAEGVDTSEAELQIQEKFTVLVRDLYAFYPLLIPFVDSNRYELQEYQMWTCKFLHRRWMLNTSIVIKIHVIIQQSKTR